MTSRYLPAASSVVLLFAAGVFLWVTYQKSHAPITTVPTTTWVPIVNPLPGQVGGVYQINVGLGVSCFLVKGEIVDSFSCVKVFDP